MRLRSADRRQPVPSRLGPITLRNDIQISPLTAAVENLVGGAGGHDAGILIHRVQSKSTARQLIQEHQGIVANVPEHPWGEFDDQCQRSIAVKDGGHAFEYSTFRPLHIHLDEINSTPLLLHERVETSDLDLDGQPAGHLDIYLRAMDEVGADVSGFRSFLSMLRLGRPYDECLNGIRARKPVRDFVSTTMDIVMNGSTVEVAAAFLYGREDPIPRMFQSLLGELQQGCLSPARMVTMIFTTSFPVLVTMPQVLSNSDAVSMS